MELGRVRPVAQRAADVACFAGVLFPGHLFFQGQRFAAVLPGVENAAELEEALLHAAPPVGARR